MAKFPTVSEGVIDPAEFQGNASKARARLHSHAHPETASIPAAAERAAAPHVGFQPAGGSGQGCQAQPRCLDSESPARRPSSARFHTPDSPQPQLESECQGAPKKVSPGAAAPNVT